jgi:hypothetical protein
MLSCRVVVRLLGTQVVGFGGAVGEVEPPSEHERDNSHQRDRRCRPEPDEGNRNPPLWAEHPCEPDGGGHHLERQEDASLKKNDVLLAAGKPGRNGGLVGIGDTLPVLDGAPDAGSCVGSEPIFEGEPPLGVGEGHLHFVDRLPEILAAVCP